jgi:hypothetical protein
MLAVGSTRRAADTIAAARVRRRPDVKSTQARIGGFIAGAGALVLIIALLALDWYQVGQHATAPIQIQRDPFPFQLAQADTVPTVPTVPGAPPGVPGVPTTPGVPGVPSTPGVPGVPTSPGVPGVPTTPGQPPFPLPPGAFKRSPPFGAWETQGFLGTVANVLMFLAAAGALILPVAAIAGRPIPHLGAILTALGALAVALVVLRMVFRPSIEFPRGVIDDIDLKEGPWVALLGALMMLAGGLLVLFSPDRGESGPTPNPTPG